MLLPFCRAKARPSAIVQGMNLVLLFLLSSFTYAKDYQADGQKFTVETIYDGKGVIWGFDFLNDDQILFSERDGKLRLLNLKTKKSHEVSGAPKVFVGGQGGLLDVFFDRKERDVYLTYTEPVGKEATPSLFKGKLNEDKTKLTGKRIFQAKALSKNEYNFGSRIVIDKDGFIFMTVGERYDRDKAQSLKFHNGKTLRLTKDGKAAAGNPFINDGLPEIWSYGHRNSQGLFIDNAGVLWEAEYGPQGGDEVNVIEKGKNYGWPVATFGEEYGGGKVGVEEKAGMVQPVFHWVPSINPSGMMIYSGKAFPKFEGNIFLASISNYIHRVVMDKDRKMVKEEKLLEDMHERFRQIRTGPDGFIYVSSDNGKIIRLRPL